MSNLSITIKSAESVAKTREIVLKQTGFEIEEAVTQYINNLVLSQYHYDKEQAANKAAQEVRDKFPNPPVIPNSNSAIVSKAKSLKKH